MSKKEQMKVEGLRGYAFRSLTHVCLSCGFCMDGKPNKVHVREKAPSNCKKCNATVFVTIIEQTDFKIENCAHCERSGLGNYDLDTEKRLHTVQVRRDNKEGKSSIAAYCKCYWCGMSGPSNVLNNSEYHAINDWNALQKAISGNIAD